MPTPDFRPTALADRPVPADRPLPTHGPVEVRVPRQRRAPEPAYPERPSATAPRPVEVSEAPQGLAGRRALVRLLTGHGLATLAQTTTSLAAGAYALERTGSASLASLTVALGVLPYVVLSGLAGLVADLLPRSTVLAWSCGLRALLVAASAGVMVLDGPVGWLAVLAVLAAVAATPAYPSVAASVTQCVPDEGLERWNAVATGVENLAWLVGPGLFGLLMVVGCPPSVVALVAAVVCTVAVLPVLGVRLSRPARGSETSPGWAAEALAGLRLVASRPRLRAAMGLAMVDNFLYGYVVVTLVLLAGGAGGVLPGALTVGALVAVVVTGRLARAVRTTRLATAGLLAFVLALLGTGLATRAAGVDLRLALPLVGLAGAATLVAEIAAVTVLQRDSDPAVLARVFGVYDQLNVGAIAVGSALAGPLAQVLGAGPALVGVAVGAGVVAALVARGLRRAPAV
ncbi:MFS transporter [Nocardioides sp. HDW12B]|uniref:MFS transporter n=1 Tax=Nocardioides sp. HDW12B TaxID=2714939 RepID=UPI00140E39CB|nr:MFS transporter [Nocardioides sp. HDW12B]QIK66866.1 MFS transporter [Nocardioides sp. HDW12B]